MSAYLDLNQAPQNRNPPYAKFNLSSSAFASITSRGLTVGVLPGLGKTSVVPEDGAVVVAEVALLDILGDGVVGLLGGDLHLGLGHLGDLNDHVVAAVALEGDVVPGADGGTALALEVEAEGFRGVLAGLLGDDRVEGGGQGTGRGAARGGEGRGSSGGGGESEEGGDGGEAHIDVQWKYRSATKQ